MSVTGAARLAYVALFAAIGASFPYLPVYYASRGLSLEEIGLLTALGAAVGLVAAPLWGAAADRFAGSRLVLPVAGLLAAASSALLVLVRDPIAIGATVAAMALAMSGIPPGLDARALETVRGDRNRYGRLRAWGSASFIASVALTGAFIERAGPPSLFWIYVGALLAFAIVSLPLRGDASELRLPRLSGIGLVLRQAALARFLAAALLVWSASMAINWYVSLHLLDLGASGELVGAAWAIGGLVEIPVMASYPWLASRIGTERLLIAGAAAFALRGLVMAAVDDPVLVALSMAIHGIGFSLVLVGGVTYVARHAPPATAATAQGILSAVVYSVALMIGPSTGSFVAGELGATALFIVASGASVIAVGLVWFAVRGERATTRLESAPAAD
jgi:MFS transporter, PPP family, 3-phenylpropionic acid transporter